MKKITIVIMSLAFIGFAHAQKLKAEAKCDLTLSIDSESGTNGLGVAYDSKSKMYYTSFAGNESYPMEAFSKKGKFSYSTTLGVDARGFWFNSTTKKLEGFTYGGLGTYEVTLSGTGAATSATAVVNENKTYNEDDQAVGTYCEKIKSVLFVSDGEARFYDKPGGLAKKVALSIADPEAMNYSPMYTGVEGKEIALFNYNTLNVEFYSATTGKKTGTSHLQAYAFSENIEIPDMFRVSYANSKVWLYDTNSRRWLGFSIW